MAYKSCYYPRKRNERRKRNGPALFFLAGFDVKDVHMTDLASGKETLEDVNMIVFCGDSLTQTYLVQPKVGLVDSCIMKRQKAFDNFYKRTDTLSLGICNGCQLMIELNLINPEHDQRAKCCIITHANLNQTL